MNDPSAMDTNEFGEDARVIKMEFTLRRHIANVDDNCQKLQMHRHKRGSSGKGKGHCQWCERVSDRHSQMEMFWRHLSPPPALRISSRSFQHAKAPRKLAFTCNCSEERVGSNGENDTCRVTLGFHRNHYGRNWSSEFAFHMMFCWASASTHGVGLALPSNNMTAIELERAGLLTDFLPTMVRWKRILGLPMVHRPCSQGRMGQTRMLVTFASGNTIAFRHHLRNRTTRR